MREQRKPRQSHRSCGHVDDLRSALLSRPVTVQRGLGTVVPVIPRCARSATTRPVVPRSSTGRPPSRPHARAPEHVSCQACIFTRSELRRVSPFSGMRSRCHDLHGQGRGRGHRHGAGGVRFAGHPAGKAEVVALTPAFAGPYHRFFGAISAPNLCLPSTMTGLRESFS